MNIMNFNFFNISRLMEINNFLKLFISMAFFTVQYTNFWKYN